MLVIMESIEVKRINKMTSIETQELLKTVASVAGRCFHCEANSSMDTLSLLL